MLRLISLAALCCLSSLSYAQNDDELTTFLDRIRGDLSPSEISDAIETGNDFLSEMERKDKYYDDLFYNIQDLKRLQCYNAWLNGDINLLAQVSTDLSESLSDINTHHNEEYADYLISWAAVYRVRVLFSTGDSAGFYDARSELYKLYDEDRLPHGIDGYYGFDSYKLGDSLNVWGYEWYPQLGDPETEGSYSKLVYYIYSTNPDGTDNEQLYRIHLLKFHGGSDEGAYLLTYQRNDEEVMYAGSYYQPGLFPLNFDHWRVQSTVRQLIVDQTLPDTWRETRLK